VFTSDTVYGQKRAENKSGGLEDWKTGS